MEGDYNVYTHSSLWMRPTRPDRYNAKMVYSWMICCSKKSQAICVVIMWYNSHRVWVRVRMVSCVLPISVVSFVWLWGCHVWIQVQGQIVLRSPSLLKFRDKFEKWIWNESLDLGIGQGEYDMLSLGADRRSSIGNRQDLI